MSEKLQNILDLYHSKDLKRELNKEEKSLYAAELYESLTEKGLNLENIRYITALPLSGGIEGFCLWRKNLDDKNISSSYDELLDSKLYSALKGGQKVKILFLLLSYELSESESNKEVIRRLLWQLEKDSYTKSGSRVSDLSASFKNYFLKLIDGSIKLPKLNELQFSENEIKQIAALFDEALVDVNTSGKKEVINKNILQQWINENHRDITGIEVAVEEKTPVQKPMKEKKNSSKVKGRLAKNLSEISFAVNILEEAVEQQNDEIEKKSKTISSLKKTVEINKDRICELEKENADLKDSLDKRVDELAIIKTEKEELNDRVSRQVSVLNAFTEDKEKSSSELLNSIASALSKYYKEYEIAKSMDLNTDLEMTLLDLLEDIFKRLEKNGIDIKGRL